MKQNHINNVVMQSCIALRYFTTQSQEHIFFPGLLLARALRKSSVSYLYFNQRKVKLSIIFKFVILVDSIEQTNILSRK